MCDLSFIFEGEGWIFNSKKRKRTEKYRFAVSIDFFLNQSITQVLTLVLLIVYLFVLWKLRLGKIVIVLFNFVRPPFLDTHSVCVYVPNFAKAIEKRRGWVG